MSLNKINTYVCNTCKESIVTVDRDEGVTPFMLACRATDGCSGMMQSSMYLCNQSVAPAWEWYRPLNLKGLDEGTRDHVSKGGLLLQRIPADDNGIANPVLRRVVVYVQNLEQVSAVTLQRKFKIDYPIADSLLNDLIQRRFIDPRKDKKGQHLVFKRVNQGLEIYEEAEQ